MEYINNYIKKHKDRFINELIEILKIPSISADPQYKLDVLNCADAVATSIKEAGAENVEICETNGYPIVKFSRFFYKFFIKRMLNFSFNQNYNRFVHFDWRNYTNSFFS